MKDPTRILWLARSLSAAVVAALVAIALLAGAALERSHRQATEAARGELETLSDAVHLHDLLYQKGFSSEYMLTGDDRWLAELDRTTKAFRDWLVTVRKNARSDVAAKIVDEIAAEYAQYDAERDRSIATFKAGDKAAAIEIGIANRSHSVRLKTLAAQLLELRRNEITSELEAAHAAFRRTLLVLGAFVAFAIALSAAIGFVLARRVGRQLAEQNARVIQAEKMSALGEMAAAVAHEVLNPLAGIKVALQLLGRTEPSEGVRETVAAVDKEIARVDRMARRLIGFARPLSPQVRPCDLGEILPRVLAHVAAESAAARVQFDVELGSPARVQADPELLEQVLLNLTLNACQAIDGPGTVRVRLRDSGGYSAIDVIDDGAGIAAEVAPKLFTPFATSRPDGHGLGLAFSQSVAIAHGGRIEGRANGGTRGSTFTVFLPAREVTT